MVWIGYPIKTMQKTGSRTLQAYMFMCMPSAQQWTSPFVQAPTSHDVDLQRLKVFIIRSWPHTKDEVQHSIQKFFLQSGMN